MLDYGHEQKCLDQGYTSIVGVDEVGRGPWAGPVTAAAVILDVNQIPQGLADSKKLTKEKRQNLYHEIMATSLVSVAHATVEEIDALNILQATFLAMTRAINGLKQPVDFALIDGNKIPPETPCKAEAIVKGDGLVLSIAAASIVAKVVRDDIMQQLNETYPDYGWDTNAGYGTAAHQRGLADKGVTVHHRRSFKPIQALL